MRKIFLSLVTLSVLLLFGNSVFSDAGAAMAYGRGLGYAILIFIAVLIFYIVSLIILYYITKRIFNYIDLKTHISSTYGELIKVFIFPTLLFIINLLLFIIFLCFFDIEYIVIFIKYFIIIFFITLIITTSISIFKKHEINKGLSLGIVFISLIGVFVLQYKLPELIKITNSTFLINILKDSDKNEVIDYFIEHKQKFILCDIFIYNKSSYCSKIEWESIDTIKAELIEKEKNSIMNCDNIYIEFKEKGLLKTNFIIRIFKDLCNNHYFIQEAINNNDVNKCSGIIYYGQAIYWDEHYVRCIGNFIGTKPWEDACKIYNKEYEKYSNKYSRDSTSKNYIIPARCNE